MGPNLSKPIDDSHSDTLSDHSSQASFATAKPHSHQPRPAAKPHSTPRQPPHITIQPWNGTSSSRQAFINQLRAYTFFHPSACRDIGEYMIWAISFFEGAAADVAGEYCRLLVEGKGEEGREGGRSEIENFDPPVTWEVFLEGYLDIVAKEVEGKREREERRRNAWPMKEIRMLWRVVVFLMRWLALGLILIAISLIMVHEVKSWMSTYPEIVWEKEGGRLPNRGYFVAKE